MNKRLTGNEYETKACEYLTSRGYEVIERNFRCHRGEIDIIAKDKDVLIFVEVKYRTTNDKGLPEEAVGPSKQKTIMQVARYYMLCHKISEFYPCRFDVIAYYFDGNFKHFENAFGGM